MLSLASWPEHIAVASNPRVGRRDTAGPEPKQRLERGHGMLAAIVTKDELVQVRLELPAADPMMGSRSASLEDSG
jgi:hypothetical protein